MRDDPNLIDLGPRLLAKKRSTCAHPSLEVDDELPSLTCTACGAEVDPYMHLRALADEESAWHAHLDERVTDIRYFEHDGSESSDARITVNVDELRQLIALLQARLPEAEAEENP